MSAGLNTWLAERSTCDLEVVEWRSKVAAASRPGNNFGSSLKYLEELFMRLQDSESKNQQ